MTEKRLARLIRYNKLTGKTAQKDRSDIGERIGNQQE